MTVPPPGLDWAQMGAGAAFLAVLASADESSINRTLEAAIDSGAVVQLFQTSTLVLVRYLREHRGVNFEWLMQKWAAEYYRRVGSPPFPAPPEPP